jgi:putative lipoprotein
MIDRSPFPARTVGVRALALAAFFGLTLASCAPVPPPKPDASPANDLTKTDEVSWVYSCRDGSQFTARFAPEQVRLFFPGRSILLPQTISGSGVRYEAETPDGPVSFHGKGDEAIVSQPGQPDRKCVGARQPGPWEQAALSGVSFRAVGHEPEWVLDITSNGPRPQITFQAVNIGGHQRFPYQDPQQAGAQRIWNVPAEGELLTILASERPCADTMADETFSHAVTVMLGDETFQGCGRALSR